MLVDALFNSAFCLLYPDYSDKQINMYDSLLKGDSILREIDALGCCKDNLLVAIEFLRLGENNDSTNFCSLFMALAYKEIDIEKAYSIFELIAYSNEKIDFRNKAWALRNLARLEAYEAFDVKRALVYFDEALYIDDTYYLDYFEITRLREELGYRIDEIEDSYEKIVACDPSNIDVYLLRAGSLADFQKAINLDCNNVEIYCVRARYKERNKDFVGALEDYTIAIGLEPNNSLLYRKRADFKDRIFSDYEGAVSDYNSAIAYAPTESLLYRNRAFLNLKLKKFAEAFEDLDIAIRLSPMDEYLYKYKAGIFEKIEAWDEALDCYNMSIIVAPSNKHNYLRRAKIYEKLHRYVDAKNDIEMSNSLGQNE